MDPKQFMQELLDGVRTAVGQAVTQASSAVFEQIRQTAQHHVAAAQQQRGTGTYGTVVVNRRDQHDRMVPQTTTVPQLLAETCDLLHDIRGELERSRRRR